MFRYRSMGVLRAICFPGAYAPNSTGPMRPRPTVARCAGIQIKKPGAQWSRLGRTLYIGPRRRITSRGATSPRLPAIVGERLVGFGHAVSVFALANRGAAVLGGLHQFGGKPMRHGLLASR